MLKRGQCYSFASGGEGHARGRFQSAPPSEPRTAAPKADARTRIASACAAGKGGGERDRAAAHKGEGARNAMAYPAGRGQRDRDTTTENTLVL